MKTLQCIIIDDEKSARTSLAQFLVDYCEQVELLGMASNIDEAKRLIDQHQPNLIFLDIEMPHGNAFDLLERFERIDFSIIFVTAFSQYAVRAFNLSAAHYLLKPVDIDLLIEAVEKVEQDQRQKCSYLHTEVLLQNIRQVNSQKNKIVIPLMDGFELVRLEDVLYMVADDNFVHIHISNGKSFMACRSLKFYEEQLQSNGFFRIHRKFLINVEHVIRFRKTKPPLVQMSNQKELELSQSKRKAFLELFKM